MPDLSDDVPEADALEQDRQVDAADRLRRPTSDPEVPEADALEQGIEVRPDHEQS